MTQSTTTLQPPQFIEVLNRWASEPGSPIGKTGIGRYSVLIRNQRGRTATNFYATNIDEALMTLNLLAVERGFVPWLRLVAGTEYTGASAAQEKLKSMGYGA